MASSKCTCLRCHLGEAFTEWGSRQADKSVDTEDMIRCILGFAAAIINASPDIEALNLDALGIMVYGIKPDGSEVNLSETRH